MSTEEITTLQNCNDLHPEKNMKLYLLMFCLLLGACSGLPQTMRDAHVKDVTYTEVIQNIDAHKDTPVSWGGVIIDVENKEDFSFVQILFYPLNHSGKPQLGTTNEGHFVIRSKEFLDPMIYTKKKEITVVGTLNGKIERKIGKRLIQVPLILSENIHLWPKEYHDEDHMLGGGGL